MAKKQPSGTLKRPSLDHLIEAAILQGGTRELVEESVLAILKTERQRKPTKAQINKAFADIMGRWLADAASAPKEIHAYHVRTRKYLYQRAHQLNDFKSCLMILADLAKMQHQYAGQQAARKRAEKEAPKKKAILTRITGGRTAGSA